jgi:CheY-like chemotaxis protein
MVDDDPDDYLLLKDALAENRLTVSLSLVANGEELLNYLHRRGKYQAEETVSRPDLIFLDLNMPGKAGHEVLKKIKADNDLKMIPIVIWATSKSKEDVMESYRLGANSFVTKPASFKSLCKVLKTVVSYWFDAVKLPASGLSILALGLLS